MTAAIYAARATLNPLVIQGNPFDDKNRINGTLPLGQLALTTEVENFPSWPAGDTRKLGIALVAGLVLLLAGVVRTQTLRSLRA